jgi:predicted RNase H-like HicB family nuclease
MKYDVVLEYDSDTGHVTATVPGIAAIVVDAKSERTALKRVQEAIAFYLEETAGEPGSRSRRPATASVTAKVVSVSV